VDQLIQVDSVAREAAVKRIDVEDVEAGVGCCAPLCRKTARYASPAAGHVHR